MINNQPLETEKKIATRPVSVVMTVFNEAASIEGVLRSLLGQSCPPAEIVVVDGGSTDGTLAIIRRIAPTTAVPIHALSRPGANISQGRNAAIQAATYELIAVTDAGVHLPPDWLQHLTDPFFQPEPTQLEPTKPSSVLSPQSSVLSPHPSSLIPQVVAGFFRSDPDPRSPFQIAMGATVLPAPDDIKPEKFLPSSRSVAFTKSAWKAAGGYPEWLDYCEDLIFDLNLKAQGYRFYWQPKAVALFAPRRTLRAFCLQYYRYARGDGKANLFLKRHILRYIIYGVFAPLGLILAWRKPLVWPLLVGCGLGYIWQAYRRLFFYLEEFKGLSLLGKVAAIGWIPVIRASGDFAKMVGYPVGLGWRLLHKKESP